MTDTGPIPRIDRSSRVIAASPDTVYAALIDPGAAVRWLPPDGMSGEILAFEPHPGGAHRMILRYADASGVSGKTDAHSDVVDGRFVALEENRRIVQAFRFTSEDLAFAGEMRMTWTLTPVAGGTEVAVAAEDVPSGISPEDHAAGLGSTLANLDAYVTGS